MSDNPIQIPVGGTVAAAGVPGSRSPNDRSVKLQQIYMEDTFSTFQVFLIYGRSAGTLITAFDGQVRAMEHSLQFTQISCLICIYSDPFPKSPHPFTHFAQPSQSFSSIVYSK